jgi:hypothetical protein
MRQGAVVNERDNGYVKVRGSEKAGAGTKKWGLLA